MLRTANDAFTACDPHAELLSHKAGNCILMQHCDIQVTQAHQAAHQPKHGVTDPLTPHYQHTGTGMVPTRSCCNCALGGAARSCWVLE